MTSLSPFDDRTCTALIVAKPVMEEEHPLTENGLRLEALVRVTGLVVSVLFIFTELCGVSALETWLGGALALVLLASLLATKRCIDLQVLDVCVAMLTLASLLSQRRSVYEPAGEGFVLRATILLILYGLLRVLGPSVAWTLFWILAGAAAILSLGYGIVTGLRYLQLTQAGFGNLVAFRDQFATLQGETPAAWITVFLALLAFPMIVLTIGKTQLERWISAAILTLALVTIGLTFSRGVYLGAATFLLGTILSAVGCKLAQRGALRRIGASVCLCVLLLLPVRSSVVSTMAMVRTGSQTRSLSGRILVWRQAKALIQTCPLTGSGPGTFAIQYEKYKEPSNPVVFSAFNIGLETLVEQGLFGLVLWGAVLALLSKRMLGVWLSRESSTEARAVAGLLLASVVSLLVRDSSYASLSTGPVLVLIIVILAVAANLRAHDVS